MDWNEEGTGEAFERRRYFIKKHKIAEDIYGGSIRVKKVQWKHYSWGKDTVEVL